MKCLCEENLSMEAKIFASKVSEEDKKELEENIASVFAELLTLHSPYEEWDEYDWSFLDEEDFFYS